MSDAATTDLFEWVPTAPEDTLAFRLRALREDMHLTLKEMAALVGVKHTTWSNWENGVSRPQDLLGMVDRIAAATGVSRQWLVLGGPLRISWFVAVPTTRGQLELALGIERPHLVRV